MPRTSCIEHPKRSRYATIWDHYLHMFDGNYPTAFILSGLEYLCNGEMDRLECDEDGESEPWFLADITEIHKAVLGVYSEKTIYDSLKRIEDAGLVIVDRRGLGKKNRYLFRFGRVQEAIKRRFVFDGNFTVEKWRSDSPSDCSSDCKITVSSTIPPFITNEYEEEYELRSKTQSPSSESTNPPEENTAPDELTVDNICEWVQDVFQEMGGKLYSRPIGSEKEKFLAMADQLGHDGLRGQIRAFIDNGGTTPTKFLRQIPGSRNTMRRETYRGSVVRERQSEDGWAPQRRSTQQSAFMGDIPHTDQTRDFVVRWNAIVTSCKPYPVSGSDMGYKVSSLAQARMDTDFINGFDEICRKVQAIRTNKGDEASWMSLNWLLSVKDAGANWARVLRGEFDFMAAKPERRRKSQADDVTDDLIRRLESGEYKP